MSSTSQDLRALADWLDAHAGAVAHISAVVIDVATTRDAMLSKAAAVGGDWRPQDIGRFVTLSQPAAGGFTYQLFIAREHLAGETAEQLAAALQERVAA